MAKKQLEQLAINEAMGDIPTHFMKSGSCMPPRDRLDVLAKFRERIIPEEYMGCPFEYDLWFNTNELRTIRAFLYTDFLGGGCFFQSAVLRHSTSWAAARASEGGEGLGPRVGVSRQPCSCGETKLAKVYSGPRCGALEARRLGPSPVAWHNVP